MKEFKRETKAFPSTYVGPDESKIHYFGMDLRDYFASAAMQAQLTRTPWKDLIGLQDLAKLAYQYADAMMEARK